MVDFNHSQPGGRINHLIDMAIVKARKKEAPRNYLGGSRLGEECERKLQYEFFHTPKDEGADFDGRIYRIFHRGHKGEDWCIQWLKDAGFDLRSGQEGFSTCDGYVAGHVDGIIHSGPDCLKYPCLWECKTLGAKGWRKLEKEKVKKAYPVYYGQMQIYMAYMDLADNPALFTALNADTMEIYHESVPFSQQDAQSLSDKGVRIIKACLAGEILPRLSDDPAWFQCKFCPYQERCHHAY